MESAPQSVSFISTVSEAGISVGEIPASTYFCVDGLQSRFWLEGQTCPFNTGDRVRITITKDPSIALPQ
jgi:hypothetical protein